MGRCSTERINAVHGAREETLVRFADQKLSPERDSQVARGSERVRASSRFRGPSYYIWHHVATIRTVGRS
jgi:hypothetical protein